MKTMALNRHSGTVRELKQEGRASPHSPPAWEVNVGDATFPPLYASLWKTKKAWQASVLGLQIHFSEEASSQIRNLQIMNMCMWIKIGDNGEENKIGLLLVLSCFKIFINVIKVFFFSSSSSYNKYISRKTIQACVWSPTPSFPPTWLPQLGQRAQRWWEWHLGVSGSQPGLFHDNRGFWNGSNRSREHLKVFLSVEAITPWLGTPPRSSQHRPVSLWLSSCPFCVAALGTSVPSETPISIFLCFDDWENKFIKMVQFFLKKKSFLKLGFFGGKIEKKKKKRSACNGSI